MWFCSLMQPEKIMYECGTHLNMLRIPSEQYFTGKCVAMDISASEVLIRCDLGALCFIWYWWSLHLIRLMWVLCTFTGKIREPAPGLPAKCNNYSYCPTSSKWQDMLRCWRKISEHVCRYQGHLIHSISWKSVVTVQKRSRVQCDLQWLFHVQANSKRIATKTQKTPLQWNTAS